jgi:diguanylate cyclase (GGDEF)-like protein
LRLYKTALRWQRFAQWLFALGPRHALPVCVVLFFAFSVLDYVTPPQLNLTFLYVFVILIACWNIGLGWGLAFAVLSFAMQIVSFSQIANPGIKPIYFYVILGNRLFTFLLTVARTVPLRKLYEREQQTARNDFLTGVPNRKAFYDLLTVELARNQRTETPFAVAYLDLDNFKQVNDEFGHDEGDTLLRVAADTIRGALRSTDTLARLGGDEFGVLLPDADVETSAQSMARVKDALDAEMAKREWNVTASIGLGSFDRPAMSADGVMTACDALMYRIKRGGKSGIACEQYVLDARRAVTSPALQRHQRQEQKSPGVSQGVDDIA